MEIEGAVVTIDEDGRVQIPENLRNVAGVHPGDVVELYTCSGGIFLRPAVAP